MTSPLQPKQFQQLPMFMSAREIQADWAPGETSPITGQVDDTLWTAKADEARQSGLTESIRREGVRDPVTLDFNDPHPSGRGSSGPAVYGGHHRIAASAEIDPDRLMPVLHHSNTEAQDWGAFDRAYPRIDGTGLGDLEPWDIEDE